MSGDRERIGNVMFICSCNGHRKSEIRKLADHGVQTAVVAYHMLDGPPRCGRCLEHAQAVIDEVHGLTDDDTDAAPAGGPPLAGNLAAS